MRTVLRSNLDSNMFRRIAMAVATFLMLGVPHATSAGVITLTVVDDKGSVSIPNGHFELVFGSRMSADLGAEWGELAGHYERRNSEKLVWVNDGPPTVIRFANLFPREVHVPQTPAPNPGTFHSFFDVFFELELDGTFGPLEPGMQIIEGPDTYLEGAAGEKYFGIVTPITDLSLLPTTGINDTEVIWDLSGFSTTIGNFYLIEYQLPPAAIANVPEPSIFALWSASVGIGMLQCMRRRRHPVRFSPDARPKSFQRDSPAA